MREYFYVLPHILSDKAMDIAEPKEGCDTTFTASCIFSIEAIT
jgi:hypothetical protein